MGVAVDAFPVGSEEELDQDSCATESTPDTVNISMMTERKMASYDVSRTTFERTAKLIKTLCDNF